MDIDIYSKNGKREINYHVKKGSNSLLRGEQIDNLDINIREIKNIEDVDNLIDFLTNIRPCFNKKSETYRICKTFSKERIDGLVFFGDIEFEWYKNLGVKPKLNNVHIFNRGNNKIDLDLDNIGNLNFFKNIVYNYSTMGKFCIKTLNGEKLSFNGCFVTEIVYNDSNITVTINYDYLTNSNNENQH